MFEALPEPVRALLAELARAGHEAVLVGGCVRDALAGLAVHDWDVATSAEPAALLALFPRAVPIGLRFGTVMVPTPAGPVDLTCYRAPTLAGDLARRDFTIDAIAYDPLRGVCIDPHGGAAATPRGGRRWSTSGPRTSHTGWRAPPARSACGRRPSP